MKNHYSFFLAILFFVIVKSSLGQESPGITQGNYAGSMMNRLNPSTMLQSKVYMDISIVSATVFGQNDFAYIPGKDINIIPLITGSESMPTYSPSGNNFLYFQNKAPKTVSSLVNVYGLSGMIMLREQSFAFYTAVRTYASAHNIPYEIPVFGAETLRYTPLHNINFDDHDFAAASLTWGEIGLSYARTILQQNNDHWALGVTVKRVQGLAAAFIKATNANYMVLNHNTIQIYDMNLDAGFSVPIDYQSNDLVTNPLFKGGGFGVDLGVTFTRRMSGFQKNYRQRICEEPYRDYFWRAGLSILDLGSISFKRNSELHQFNVVNATLEEIDKINVGSLDQLMGELSSRLLNDPDASYIGDSFKIGLPTAISGQFDLHFQPNWYINALVVHPLTVNKYNVRRPAEIAITPRYETDWFEFMVPISLYEYTQARVGLAMRFGVLTLGTEQLLSILSIGNVKGMDFYAGIKINFRKGICLFGNDNGACSTDYGYKPKRKSLLRSGNLFR
ncbi:MAG: DUF5723 family protein [Bacteroidales bacterium]